jgi:hypothetical protein
MKISGLTTPFPAADGNPATLDVRVAFFDTEDDETKAVGSLTVDVTGSGVSLARTEILLTDEHKHHLHWDPVTQTYSVRLTLAGGSEPQPGQSIEIRANFVGEDGALMKASRDIKWPRKEQFVPPALEKGQ